MSDIPIYEAVRAEILIDPEVVSREIDEALIHWHLARQQKDLH